MINQYRSQQTVSFMQMTDVKQPRMYETSKKVSIRNNLLRKLTGTNWSANARTLRTTATAEYCCPVWERSTHRRR